MMVKLTDAEGYTRRGQSGETHWETGCTRSPVGQGTEPCGPGVIHAYQSPLQAVLCDPIHGHYGRMTRAYAVAAPPEHQWQTDGLKWWTQKPVALGESVMLPVVTLEQRIAWAIVIAPHPSTQAWAIEWLAGRDRTNGAARAAAKTARAAEAAAWAAKAAWAAESARAAVEASTKAATWVVWAAEATAEAARAAEAAQAAIDKWWEARAVPAWDRAQTILAGTYPADQYDAPFTKVM